MALVQQNSGTTQSVSSITTSLGVATTAGNSILLFVNCSNTVTTPSGFTSRSPQVNIQGLYLFEKLVASGNATDTPALTQGGSGNSTWFIAEYSNLTAYVTSNGANTGFAATGAVTGASITPSAGTRRLVAFFGVTNATKTDIFGANQPATWINSFTNWRSLTRTGAASPAGNDSMIGGWADRIVTASGSTAYNTGATFTSATNSASANIIAAYTDTSTAGLPLPITGISTAVAPVGPFKVAAGGYASLSIDTAMNTASTNGTLYGPVGIGSNDKASAQSFTNGGSSLVIASVQTPLSIIGTPTGDVYAEITATSPSGTVLATSNSVACSSLTGTGFSNAGWVTFTFSSPPTISASATFAVVLRRTVGDASNYIRYGISASSTYAGGTAYRFDGTTFLSQTYDIKYLVNGTVTIASDRYYFFGRDGTTATTLQAYKATAPDTSWSSIATKTGFATGVQFISAYQKDHIIHMCVTDGATTSINHKYQTFDASTDTFVTAETINSALNTQTSASANAYETSIVVRSVYEVVLYHHAARISTFAQTAYRRRTAPATWAAAVAVSATGTNCTNPIVVLGALDRLHFLHFNATNTIQRHLTSANVLGTAASTGATALPQDVNTRDDAGTIRHVGFTAASAFRWASADNPTVTNAAVTFGTPVRTIEDNAVVYALYQDSTGVDLDAKSSSDSGATFGSAVNAFAGMVTSADANLSKNQSVYVRGSNYVFPYLVLNNSGAWLYNEYTVRSSGPTAYTLTADTGTLTAAGQTVVPRVTMPIPLDADLIFAGQTAALRTARKTAAGLGTLTLAGQDVTLTKTTAITHRTMPADTGTLTLAGQTTVPRVTMPVTLGTLTLTGQPVAVRYTRIPLAAGQGTLTLSGQTVTLRYARKMPAGLGTITLAGQPATLKRNYVMPATLGTITLAGAAPNLIYSGAGSKTLPAGLGTITLAGQTVTVRYAHKLIAGTGTITLAGQTVGLRASHVPLAAGLGTLTLSGQVVATRFAHSTVAGLGTLTLAGQTAIVRYARRMPAGQGTLTPSGQNVTLRYSRKMPAGLGTITLAGPVVNTIYSGSGNKLLPAGLGILTPAGQPVTLRYSRKMPAALGTITLAGQIVALQRARKVTAGVGSIVLEGKAAGLNYRSQARLIAETGVLGLTGCDVTLPVTRRPPTIVQENLKFGRSVYVSRW